MANTAKHALIVGASRGLGLGIVEHLLGRGWTVTATVRKPSAGLEKLAGPALRVETADIDDDQAVTALHTTLAAERYDLLFVVAGISNGHEETLPKTERPAATKIFQTNSVSPIRFADVFHDLVAPGGTIALMTSRLGSVAFNTRGGWEVYRASKAALNTLGRSFQLRHAGAPWDVVLMHPGWVRTDMGGSNADIDVETSVVGMLDVLEQPGRSGCVFVDYKGDIIPW
jgi:NAD(P)-dependent dehydrogenase (short-subunit alcohol dehydrogenase family)